MDGNTYRVGLIPEFLIDEDFQQSRVTRLLLDTCFSEKLHDRRVSGANGGGDGAHRRQRDMYDDAYGQNFTGSRFGPLNYSLPFLGSRDQTSQLTQCFLIISI